MPTYEYQCKKCGKVMDEFQSITAKPLKKLHCDKCGNVQAVERLMGTGGALIFKGSGFYQTDYRSDSYKQSAKSESPTAGDAKSSSDSSSGASTGSSDSAKSSDAAPAKSADTKPAAPKPDNTTSKKKKTGS